MSLNYIYCDAQILQLAIRLVLYKMRISTTFHYEDPSYLEFRDQGVYVVVMMFALPSSIFILVIHPMMMVQGSKGTKKNLNFSQNYRHDMRAFQLVPFYVPMALLNSQPHRKRKKNPTLESSLEGETFENPKNETLKEIPDNRYKPPVILTPSSNTTTSICTEHDDGPDLSLLDEIPYPFSLPSSLQMIMGQQDDSHSQSTRSLNPIEKKRKPLQKDQRSKFQCLVESEFVKNPHAFVMNETTMNVKCVNAGCLRELGGRYKYKCFPNNEKYYFCSTCYNHANRTGKIRNHKNLELAKEAHHFKEFHVFDTFDNRKCINKSCGADLETSKDPKLHSLTMNGIHYYLCNFCANTLKIEGLVMSLKVCMKCGKQLSPDDVEQYCPECFKNSDPLNDMTEILEEGGQGEGSL